MAKGNSFICQTCGIEAPSKYIEFYSNIGMVVARQTRFIKGYQCKRCIHKNFWKYSLMDLTLGWWGMISVVVTPIYFINNLARYFGALSLPAPDANAAPPVVGEAEIKKLAPFVQEISDRLTQKEAIQAIAPDIARRAGATPGQVIKYVRMLAQSQQQARPAPPPAKGSPVVAKNQPPVVAAPASVPPAAPPIAVAPEPEPLELVQPSEPQEPQIGIQ
ncbi:MAG TPA: hypothetical protein VMD30_08575 [Tepidisphaeraceae bacterium]|nr:hypothetical protein [Tepidisphaeraceae bacterium]